MQPTGLSRTPVRHEPCGFFFLDMHLNIAVFSKQHYLANNFVNYKSHEQSRTPVRHEPCGFFFLAMHLNIAVFTHSL